MARIRVLVVDDSAVVRHLVPAALSADPDIEVVGTARDGIDALDRLAEYAPDLILLDVEMPRMDGLQTLVALRQRDPRLPVIMFSRHTHRGVEATVHALTLGANDYVPKPGDGLALERCVQELLLPRIKLLAGRSPNGSPPDTRGAATSPVAPEPLPRRARVEVVVLGASTGGPNALATVLPALPRTGCPPILIVQHMPTGFTARLAQRLAEQSGMDVCEATGSTAVTAAQAWVAPGNHHMVLRRLRQGIRVAIHQDPPENSCRPSVDVLFRSAAEVYGAGVLAVVLTGMGQDGLRGCEAVRAAGGQILVQDESTSVVWSMPGCVARAGLADAVLPLNGLGPAIVRRLQRNQQA